MGRISLQSMRGYLSRSIASRHGDNGAINRNKLNGLLAEIEFRRHLIALGFGDRVSAGGWIARSVGPGEFGHRTVVLFPRTIEPGTDFGPESLPAPSNGLHTICATFHQIGIHSYFCSPVVIADDD